MNDPKNTSRIQRQSRRWGLLIAVGLFLLVIVILASVKVTLFAVYENKNFGIRIKYPQSWEIVENPQGVDAVVFMSPAQDDTDIYRENVNVTRVGLTPDKSTPQAFTETTIRQLTGLFGTDIEIVRSRPITIDGRQGYLLIFAGRGTAEPVEYLHAWVLKGPTAYIVTYTALKKDFNNYSRDVLDMIKTLKLL